MAPGMLMTVHNEDPLQQATLLGERDRPASHQSASRRLATHTEW